MLMKTICVSLLLLATAVPELRADNDYHYFADLAHVNNDKVSVRLTPPDITASEATFMFPAMVPGTYEVYNFGRFIDNFKVEGKDGQTITVKKLDDNSYRLSPASAIREISYEVNDTWDTDIKEKFVFEPGGTGIDADKAFAINTHGFFGYFKDMTARNFILNITKPAGFYASTGLQDVRSGKTEDVISVFDYHDLVDSPILYCLPDTTTIRVGNAQVLVSVYSPNHILSSDFVSRHLYDLLMAQRDYLGGELPVNKYAFLFYFTDKPTLSGSSGALEHSYSSFYVLPEADTSAMAQEIRDVAAHEFFHIVTPLNIHSEEIGNFDFNDPKMSRHLWLYEGLTEYAAHLVQVKGGLIDLDAFFDVMTGKMQNARANYNDTVPFTTMSKYVLDKYKSQYPNVYEKGALIGMCLDIQLRYYSNGTYGTQELMKDLSKKYGKNRSFKDDDLFNDIQALTYPEIGTFLRTYVGGNKPLPFKEVFNMVGLNYTDKRAEKRITLGGISVGFNPSTNRLVVASTEKLDAFGKKLGFKEGDELLSFNNRKLTLENIREIFADYFTNAKAKDKLTVEVLRKEKNGKEVTKVLKAKIKPVEVMETDILEVNKNATDKQVAARRAWLGIK